ncbi:hypothetical protein BDV11DRAFT_125300 [Aspergillus similis]
MTLKAVVSVTPSCEDTFILLNSTYYNAQIIRTGTFSPDYLSTRVEDRSILLEPYEHYPTLACSSPSYPNFHTSILLRHLSTFFALTTALANSFLLYGTWYIMYNNSTVQQTRWLWPTSIKTGLSQDMKLYANLCD